MTTEMTTKWSRVIIRTGNIILEDDGSLEVAQNQQMWSGAGQQNNPK